MNGSSISIKSSCKTTKQAKKTPDGNEGCEKYELQYDEDDDDTDSNFSEEDDSETGSSFSDEDDDIESSDIDITFSYDRPDDSVKSKGPVTKDGSSSGVFQIDHNMTNSNDL